MRQANDTGGVARSVMVAATLAVCAAVLVGCPPGDIVIFTDRGLENAVRAELGNPFGFFTRTELLELRELDARGMLIRDLSGLEHCTNLTFLDLDTNEIADLTPLTNLVNLMYLNLDNNGVTSIVALAGLLNLDELSLSGNEVADIGALVTNAANGGLGPGDYVILDEQFLSQQALDVDVPTLQSYGVDVVGPGSLSR